VMPMKSVRVQFQTVKQVFLHFIVPINFIVVSHRSHVGALSRQLQTVTKVPVTACTLPARC
jgi:hypothetical protein